MTDANIVEDNVSQTDADSDIRIISPDALVILVKVYITADKYDIPALSQLSKSKYELLLPQHWNSAALSSSLRLLFDETREEDRLLKEVAIHFASTKMSELIERMDFIDLVRENGEIGLELLKACFQGGLANTVTGSSPKKAKTTVTALVGALKPACIVCNSNGGVETARHVPAGKVIWWCGGCRCRFA